MFIYCNTAFSSRPTEESLRDKYVHNSVAVLQTRLNFKNLITKIYYYNKFC